MRRLRDFQPVALNLAGAPVPALVTATSGATAWLDLDDALLPEGLPLPARSELSFTHERHFVMLAGVVVRDARNLLTFRADPLGQIHNHRMTPRLAITLPVLVEAVGGRLAGQTFESRTVDLGSGGVLVEAQDIGTRGDHLSLLLQLPGAGGELEVGGRIARVAPSGTAVAFTRVDAGAQVLLDSFVLTVRAELARRFAGRA